MYDYVIAGAGLFGSIFAHEATKRGKKCIVFERRSHIGGNCYTEIREGINVHVYGAHIFHTSDRRVWNYVNQFAVFNNFINAPIANFKGKLYNLPFNMNTFYELWGVRTPQEAKQKIEEQRKAAAIAIPTNLEEQAIALVGTDIYETLIKGYTEKQWGRRAAELPAFIIRRIPLRFVFDNNYFNDTFQGIPIGGYTTIFEKLLEGVEIELGTDFITEKTRLQSLSTKCVFTGMIDQYFDYRYGALEYRSLRFDHETIATDNFQGNAVINYTEYNIPYTRILEHKHFEFGTQPKTIITKEYPAAWNTSKEPYYPINDQANAERYKLYADCARAENNVIFGGRLADYQYYDMHHVIALALKAVRKELDER